jgi:hypothetical protein
LPIRAGHGARRSVGEKRQKSGEREQATYHHSALSDCPKASELVWARDNSLKLELNDQERRAVGKSLAERKARLIENAGDTTQPRAAKRSGSFELKAIASVLRKLDRAL